jgi:hypothetical protein
MVISSGVGRLAVIRIDRIYRLGFVCYLQSAAGKIYISSGLFFPEASTMMEQIEKLVERFEGLKEGERTEAAAILKRYAEGGMDLEEVHYTLLDEGLIPMPSRCTMYNKPKKSPEAEEALKSLIKEKIAGL